MYKLSISIFIFFALLPLQIVANDNEIILAAKNYIRAVEKQEYEIQYSLRDTANIKASKAKIIALLKNAKKQGKINNVLKVFYGADTLLDVEKMEPKQLYVSIVKGVLSYQSHLKYSIKNASFDFIGSIQESNTIAYVVLRSKYLEGEPKNNTGLITLSKSSDRWKVVKHDGFGNIFEIVLTDLERRF